MKECKEGIYVIVNIWVKKTEKNKMWPYIKLSVYKIMDMV